MFSNNSPQRWMITGMAGAMFIAVTQLATRTDLTRAHKFAATCFAFAIPICCGLFMEWAHAVRKEDPHPPRWNVDFLKQIIAAGSFILGSGAFFYSFGRWTGLAFVIGRGLTFISWYKDL